MEGLPLFSAGGARVAPATPGVMVQAEILNLAAQSVAVDAHHVSGFAPIAVALFENPADEPLFELADSVFVGDSGLHELVDQGFKLLFHGRTPIGKIAQPYASIL